MKEQAGKIFEITLNREVKDLAVMEIFALSQEEAEGIALETVGDHDFSEVLSSQIYVHETGTEEEEEPPAPASPTPSEGGGIFKRVEIHFCVEDHYFITATVPEDHVENHALLTAFISDNNLDCSENMALDVGGTGIVSVTVLEDGPSKL